jgi:hypothetical protein
MVFIPPNAGERFYARLVLSVVKSLQSFQDLQTYNGIVYGSIREACVACGLLEDDNEWLWTLEDAIFFQSCYVIASRMPDLGSV